LAIGFFIFSFSFFLTSSIGSTKVLASACQDGGNWDSSQDGDNDTCEYYNGAANAGACWSHAGSGCSFVSANNTCVCGGGQEPQSDIQMTSCGDTSTTWINRGEASGTIEVANCSESHQSASTIGECRVGCSSGTVTLRPGESITVSPNVPQCGKWQFDVHGNFQSCAKSQCVDSGCDLTFGGEHIDLSLTKSVNNPNPRRGDAIVYNLRVENKGDATTADAFIQETLPNNITWGSISPNVQCIFVGEEFRCNVGTFGVNEVKTFNLTAYVGNEALGNLTNNACISIPDDADLSNDCDDATVTVQVPQTPNLTISKIARLNTQVFEGPLPKWWNMVSPNTYMSYHHFDKYITYEIKVQNLGNGVAQNVLVRDQFKSAIGGPGYEPVAVRFVPEKSSVGCSVVSGDMTVTALVECNFGDIGPDGFYKTMYVTVVPYPEVNGATAIGQVINEACIFVNNVPTDICDDEDIDMSDFEIIKSGPAVAIRPGGVYEFSLTVKNNGPFWHAVNVQVFDKIPQGAEVLVDQIQSDSFTCQIVQRDDGAYLWCKLNTGLSFGSGEQKTIRVPMRFANEGRYCNVGHVRSGRYDWLISNNTSTHCVDVTIPTPELADVTVIKSVNNQNPIQGENIVYSLVARNLSSSIVARNVVIRDPLPLGVEIISMDDRCRLIRGGVNGIIICELGDINPGQSIEVLINLRVRNDSIGSILNRACVESDNDSNPNNNCDDETITVIQGFIDIAVTKDDGIVEVRPNDTTSYTIRIKNIGNIRANNVIFRDLLPENMTFVSISNALCRLEGVNIVCRGFDLLPNEELVFTITMRVNSIIPAGVNYIDNMGCAYSYDSEGNRVFEPNFANNCGSDRNTLVAQPDLMVIKTTDKPFVNPGDQLTYTINVSNKGNQGATGVVITETIPKHTVFDAANSTPGWVCQGVVCTYRFDGELLPGQSFAIRFAVRVLADITNVQIISNGVVVIDDGNNGSDPTPDDNRYTVSTEVRYPEILGTQPPTLPDSGSNSTIALIWGFLTMLITLSIWLFRYKVSDSMFLNQIEP